MPTTIPEPVNLIVLGDAADCRGPDADVADLVGSLDGEIVIVGDLAYPTGSVEAFNQCFLPLYEDEIERIHAVPGDNDYEGSTGAQAYFDAIGMGAGEPGKGWWTFDHGAWQVIGLNSQCKEIDWCGPQSPQYQFLKETLESRPGACRAVLWHMPRFSSSVNYRGIAALGDLYSLLFEHGTDLLLVGNSHHYERFEPLDPEGAPHPQGIANFTLGIGGAAFSGFGDPLPGSVVRNDESHGVLNLELAVDSYMWEFIPSHAEATLEDRGSRACNNAN